ncbi:hypothetical protein [Abyssalbus ytuae]|uniref:Uncharacterized protein n=1 Tax=Abyssalbus ytuae TaxID=2926907 RepID=A0A9E7D381_9FLAO|nr:hypothetical protein [Abyssalbus ytuae]UOB17559.1 hypothetical protein MQE35_17700 [Abyssalbus ytuae]
MPKVIAINRTIATTKLGLNSIGLFGSPVEICNNSAVIPPPIKLITILNHIFLNNFIFLKYNANNFVYDFGWGRTHAEL